MPKNIRKGFFRKQQKRDLQFLFVVPDPVGRDLPQRIPGGFAESGKGVQVGSFYAASSQEAFNLFFTVARDQAPQGRTGSPADPARPVNSNRIQPAFRDASGLDDGALDQLLGDDIDPLSSSAGKSGANRGTRGITGSLDPAETMPAGGGAVSGSFPFLGQGLQGPGTPFLLDAQNGGLLGGGRGGSAQLPAGSGESIPHLITGGHFGTSGAVWPSYTPPSLRRQRRPSG